MKPQIEELLLQFGNSFGTMAVRVWKPERPRGTVFCIHGFEGNGCDFDFLASRLVEQNLSVVCPDMIGRGRSTYFGDAAKYSFEAYFVCIGALSRFAGEKNYFLGTSWGGAIAMFFLYGKRVRIEKLILNDVGLRGGLAVDARMDFLRKDSAAEFDNVADAYAHVRRTRDYLGEFPERLWPDFLASRIRFADGKYRLAYDPMTIPEARERQYDLMPILEKIDSDVLLLFGEHSEIYDTAAVAALLSKRPRFSCIPGLKAGHPPSLRTDEQVDLITRYLAE
jgi:pimeloyl-ACP methyl ester carboxylesterase